MNSKAPIEKDPIRKMVFNLKWTKGEIAFLETFFMSRGEHYLSKLIKRSPSAIRSMANRLNLKKLSYRADIRLTYTEKQVILGSLLGDMYCRIKSTCRNAQLEEAHSVKQKPYLLWKLEKLKNISFSLRKTRIGCWHSESKTYPLLNHYHKLFYKNGKKHINTEILDKIDPMGLAVWYMDDGCYGKKDGDCTLHTNGFTYKENSIIKKWFENKWNFSPKIYVWKDEKRYPNIKKYYLHFNVFDTKKLIKIIEPYMCPIMEYKIGNYVHEKNGKPMEVLKW